MSNLLAARFANAAVMVSADRADWLGECLSSVSSELKMISARWAAEPAMMQDDFWPAADHWSAAYRPYKINAQGTLTIPIKGVLLHDFPYQLFDWATGYVYIQKAFERGMADPQVKRIAMEMNSGGGEVAGNFDLVDRIYEMRGQKPITAFVNEHSYSACFSLATAADRVIVPRTGGVGSVGVLTSHADISGALEKGGYKITLIYSGKHKVDGNPYEGLKPEVKARIEARLDSMRQLFAATVARNMGMSVEAVLATEAQTYSAAEAVDIGFAHEIRPIDEAQAAFSGALDNPAGDEQMAITPEEAAAHAEAVNQASAAGRTEGAVAERTRISGILTHAEAAERGPLATHLAMGTDMSVEAAVGVLTASAKNAPVVAEVEKPKADSAFAAAMENGNPGITPQGDNNNESAEDVMAEFRAANNIGSTK